MRPDEIARPRIADFTRRLGLNEEDACGLFNDWIFDSGRETQFVLHADARESLNSAWRIAHRHGTWTVFADLACDSFHLECQKLMLSVCYQCKETLVLFMEYGLGWQ